MLYILVFRWFASIPLIVERRSKEGWGTLAGCYSRKWELRPFCPVCGTHTTQLPSIQPTASMASNLLLLVQWLAPNERTVRQRRRSTERMSSKSQERLHRGCCSWGCATVAVCEYVCVCWGYGYEAAVLRPNLLQQGGRWSETLIVVDINTLCPKCCIITEAVYVHCSHHNIKISISQQLNGMLIYFANSVNSRLEQVIKCQYSILKYA